MKIELNTLVAHFARASFRVQGVYHYTIEPGMAGWQQTAPFPGFIFPLSGQAELQFNGTPYLAGAGNVIHGGADMSLDKRVVGNTKWEYISLLYDIVGTEPEGICLREAHFALAVGHSPHLTEILWRLWEAFNQPGALPAFRTQTLFHRALEEVFVRARSQISGSAQALFEQVSSCIHEHYMDALTVRGLAAQSGVNENRLFYVFSKFAGMGPGDYLIACRLNRAKELLITGDGPVGEVAKSVGYSDALYFSRMFRDRFGVPPSTLREKFRNNPCGFQDASIPIE
ncbi:DNA-binding helix-turn-helix protein [Clostridium sp. MSTE9]|uniref:helix-turn-helix transcriptional regulator n=1 Tax=Clostridium sp. (strain MSTE9) TaxID=1105031 RepID=UPI00026F2A08|nr:AraC family transcriptional regulator [Clostridium sp. MSTE9]EJF39150.1 DNA-binding helix-turn-helix protein [Clostridium sp. MSTE9]